MTQTLSRDDLLREVPGLDEALLDTCLERGWVRPSRAEGTDVFLAIDAARLRFILELRADFGVSDEAMGLVLGLIDQVHDLRREVARLEGETRPKARKGVKRQIPLKRAAPKPLP